jgi:hypothetical protein
MMTLIAAAALAAQAPAALAQHPAMAGHMQHQGMAAEHKDCCKDCCKDMAAKHKGHAERGGHAGE